jgi:hypothetical protein
MQARVIRFTCKLVFTGAIIFSGGTVLFTEHMERIATPISAYATISELPILTERQYRYDSAVCLKQSYYNASDSDVLDTPTSSLTPLENPESNIHDLYTLDTLIAYNTAEIIEDDELASRIQQEQETVTKLPAKQSSNGIDTTETPSDQGIEKTFDTKITDTPAKQVLTRIRTKIKYVETILKKAVIEPYHINGQIEGLQINGLDKILVAKDLLLKSGDIIRTVNGHSLKSKKRAYQVFKRARKLPTMEIELLRDGKSTKLLYYLK